MGKSRPDIARMTRAAKRAKIYRARMRQQKLLELTVPSFEPRFEPERVATAFEMEANWATFSDAVARANMLNALNRYSTKNNYVHNPLPSVEAFPKEEVGESLLDTQDKVSVKVEFETEEEMERRLAYENHCVKIENINVFKVEPVDE